MLPKKSRVTKKVFQTIMDEGKTFSTQLFLFFYTKSIFTKYAIVAPKKIFKNAVKRNKFRRISYNILKSIPIKSSSGIFVYKKQAIIATQPEIKENILFIFKKTGIYG